MKKILLEIGKVITAIGVIGGSALWFDAKFDSSSAGDDRILDSIADLKQEVEYVNTEQRFMAEDIMDMKDTMARIEGKVDANAASNARLYRAIKFEIEHRGEYTEAQLDQIKAELLKKNSDLTVSTETPSAEPD